MMNAEHRRPLAALFAVFAVACLIMANGLRTQVVDVLIGAPAPSETVAIGPDTVLGQSLRDAPQAPSEVVRLPASSAPVVQAAAASTAALTSTSTSSSVVVPVVAKKAAPARPATKKKPPVTKPVTKPRSGSEAKPGTGQAAPAAPLPGKGVVTTPTKPTTPTPAFGAGGDKGGQTGGQNGGKPGRAHGHHVKHPGPPKPASGNEKASPPRRGGHGHVITPPQRKNIASATSRGHQVRQQQTRRHETRQHETRQREGNGPRSTNEHRNGHDRGDRGGRHSVHHR